MSAPHRLDSATHPEAPVDAANVRDRIVTRHGIPVVPRLGSPLLKAAQQMATTSRARSQSFDVSSADDAESYIIVDANHALKKLVRWRELMPRVKPFFAIKCHPDPILIKSLVLV